MLSKRKRDNGSDSGDAESSSASSPPLKTKTPKKVTSEDVCEFVSKHSAQLKESVTKHIDSTLDDLKQKMKNWDYSSIRQCATNIYAYNTVSSESKALLHLLDSELGDQDGVMRAAAAKIHQLSTIHENSYSESQIKTVHLLEDMSYAQKSVTEPTEQCVLCLTDVRKAKGNYVSWPGCTHVLHINCFIDYHIGSGKNRRFRLCPTCSSPGSCYEQQQQQEKV